MGTSGVLLLIVIFAFAFFGAILCGRTGILPKGRWRTGPVTIAVFLVGLGCGLWIGGHQVKWGPVDSAHALLVKAIVVLGAVAFALIPAAAALIWCTVHNQRIVR